MWSTPNPHPNPFISLLLGIKLEPTRPRCCLGWSLNGTVLSGAHHANRFHLLSIFIFLKALFSLRVTSFPYLLWSSFHKNLICILVHIFSISFNNNTHASSMLQELAVKMQNATPVTNLLENPQRKHSLLGIRLKGWMWWFWSHPLSSGSLA